MSVPSKLRQLCQRFERNLDAYKQGRYKEAQLRKEFIDPLFELIGWDMDNKQGYAEAYKEVIHEDAITVGGATKAPDYCFRIGGVRKFFMETKKPSIDIKGDVHPAYQLRRYAWSAKLPLSILTDFEELAVYDCRIKPVKTDKAATARILYLTHKDYPKQWDQIVGIFSPEAIRKGSFDKWVEEKKTKRGTAEVDSAFLAEIERWRDLLARNIALRNPKLSQRELNFATQRTIDRIIFLRICEDRGIEPYGQLMGLQNGENVYKRLMELFDRADDRYNSGLFHFQHEDGRPDESIDALTPDLVIDDRVLKDIFKSLYYPDSPYEFSVLPADILGQVYEQFLGKVIRLTPGHRAVVEDKPEVRKAGGVYYTPTYIVDYIVKQTVGKLLEGKKPGPRSPVNKLRILDPACGSGSFLLGAYQYLLDWHRDQNIDDDPKKWTRARSPRLFKAESGEWKLTTQERKRILMNNIYGVDIDRQAVEVTKLSLLLKVMEDEQSVVRQLSFFRERVLPDLGDNIKCGNSLIGPDFWEGKQMGLLDDEEMLRINAFDWNAEFPEIMKAGGFDAVIGNPPYIRIQALKEWAPTEVEFYKQRYTVASKGNYDIYVVFVEQALQLLNDRGLLGYILPSKFMQTKYGQALRGLIANGRHLSEIVHFGAQQVFYGATTYTCLLFLNKKGNSRFRYVQADKLGDWRANGAAIEGKVHAERVTDKEWNFVVGQGAKLFDRLCEMPFKLKDIAKRVFQGIIPGMDAVYSVELIWEEAEIARCYSRALSREISIERSILRKIASGVQVKAYTIEDNKSRVIYPYEFLEDVCILILPDKMKQNFPLAYAYFQQTRDLLSKRDRGSAKGAEWYRYIRTQNIDLQAFAKVAVPRLVRRLCAAFDAQAEFCLDNVDVGGIILPSADRNDYLYLMALLNSKVLDFFFRNNSVPFRGDFYSANRQFIEQLPIRTIDFSSPTDKACHNKMVALVERMLDLHKKLAKAESPQTRITITRQIEATDRQIDQLVYELYGLTEKEIRIVEEGLG